MTGVETVGGYGSIIVNVVNEKEEPKTITFNLAPLSMAEEIQLNNELKALIETERSRKRDKQITEIGNLPYSWAVGEYVGRIAKLVTDEITQYHVNDIRQTLEGTQVELWHRAKKTQPNLRREEVQACVVIGTWEPVFEQMIQIANPKTPHKS